METPTLLEVDGDRHVLTSDKDSTRTSCTFSMVKRSSGLRCHICNIVLYSKAGQHNGCANRLPTPMEIAVSTAVKRAYGVRPSENTSHITTPNDHTSVACVYTFSCRLSGAIHFTGTRSGPTLVYLLIAQVRG